MPTKQRRGRKMAMDKAELDAFLAAEHTLVPDKITSWDFRKLPG
jgi:hypothetical protein